MEMSKNIVKQYYEDEAYNYNKEFYEDKEVYPTLIYRQNYILQMINSLHLPKESKILDVGCGPGELVIKLHEYFDTLIGLDIASEMIEIANRKKLKYAPNSNLTFEIGDIENLKFRNETFDLIVCSGVVEYLNNDEEWMKEVKRVLKPDGHLIINVTNKYSIRKWSWALIENLKSSKPLLVTMNFIKQRILKKGKIHHFPFRPRLHSPKKFDAFLCQNGFTKIYHNYFDFALFPAPFDALLGFLTTRIRRSMEKYTSKNMFLNGTGYIVMVKNDK